MSDSTPHTELRNRIIGELRRDPVDVVAIVQALDDLVEQLEAAQEALRRIAEGDRPTDGATWHSGKSWRIELARQTLGSSPAIIPSSESPVVKSGADTSGPSGVPGAGDSVPATSSGIDGEEPCPDCGAPRKQGCGCWLNRPDHPWASAPAKRPT